MSEISAVLDEIATRFASDRESAAYLRTHGRRYRLLLDRVAEAVRASSGEPVRVLDVGPAYQTEAMRRLWPEVRVDSLGFEDPRLLPPRPGERHVQLDLTASADGVGGEPYDVVVCAEVIEHLHVSPLRALRLLAALLRPGGTLVLQTPNAAALSRRFWLLLGRNPFEEIRDDLHQAGHFREYTVAELRQMVRTAGLEPARVELDNYFVTGSRKNRLLVALSPLLPPRLRQGVTLTARKPA